MEVTKAIRARRSIRKYKCDIEIPQKDIDLMLEAAMMAPSAFNSRPWEFVVVKSKEKRKEIMAVHPYAKMLLDASLVITVCGRPDLQPGIPEGFWSQACSAAIQNILLQATDLGYGTVWCGVYPNKERTDGISQVLGITSVPLAVVAVGIADEQPNARGFYDLERVKYV